MLMVAWRAMTSRERGVKVAGLTLDKSYGINKSDKNVTQRK